MQKRLALVILLGLLGCQEKTPRYIAVNGSATVKAPVNSFQVRVSVMTEGTSFAKANEDNKSLVLKVFDVLKKYHISDSDFVTNSSETAEGSLPFRYSLYGDQEKKPPSINYSGTLILRNPELYDVIFRELVGLGKVDVGVFGFACDSVDQYKNDAYREAVANAKRQAEFLLQGTGNKLGKVFKVLQDAHDRYNEYDDIEAVVAARRTMEVMAMASIGDARPNTFRKKTFDVNATVTIIYEIE